MVTMVIIPRSHSMGALCIDDRCLSVRLSVPDPKSRMERRRKLEIGREEASDTRYP